MCVVSHPTSGTCSWYYWPIFQRHPLNLSSIWATEGFLTWNAVEKHGSSLHTKHDLCLVWQYVIIYQTNLPRMDLWVPHVMATVSCLTVQTCSSWTCSRSAANTVSNTCRLPDNMECSSIVLPQQSRASISWRYCTETRRTQAPVVYTTEHPVSRRDILSRSCAINDKR